MYLKQTGRLALEAGQADVTAGLEKLATQQNQPRKSASLSTIAAAHIQDDNLRTATRRFTRHATSFVMRQVLASGK